MDNKEPKINKQRVITALKNWSPFGLCEGTLVQANGDRKKTEACAIGCLALEFSTSRSGRRFFEKVGTDRKDFLKKYIYNNGGMHHVPGFKDAIHKFFGLTADTESEIMSYNDNCMERKGRPDADQKKLVPKSVQKTIYSLRKKFVKFDEKRDRAEG